jgi:hypothetical protein
MVRDVIKLGVKSKLGSSPLPRLNQRVLFAFDVDSKFLLFYKSFEFGS